MGGKTKNKMLLICNDKQKKGSDEQKSQKWTDHAAEEQRWSVDLVVFCKQFAINNSKHRDKSAEKWQNYWKSTKGMQQLAEANLRLIMKAVQREETRSLKSCGLAVAVNKLNCILQNKTHTSSATSAPTVL